MTVLALLVGSACSSSDGDGANGTADTEVTSGSTASTGSDPTDSVATSDSTSDTSGGATGGSTGDTTSGSGAGPDERGTLVWDLCDDAGNDAVVLECATLLVPVDYDEPEGDKIGLTVARFRSALQDTSGSERIGSLVFNPGGPGASGLDLLGSIPLSMSDEIVSRFDLVSFDPRGVGASTPLDCASDWDDKVSLLDEGDDAGWQQVIDDTEAELATCTAETEVFSGAVGTNNAARDLDAIREALGDEQLSYVGYSYGTRLGATYAELFPQNVRALVLDGGVKPSSDFAELDIEQGQGFDLALGNFAAACDSDPDCLLQELGPTLDVVTGLQTEIAEVGSFPTDDPERVLTPGELSLGIAAALYSKELWGFLASGLYTADTEQDGTLLQALADGLTGRQPDGSYNNAQVAQRFINCADDPARPDEVEQRANAERAADGSVYFDDLLRASTGCLGMQPAADPLVVGPAVGAAPIVVIGNSGDPATPFEWSVELAASLDSAVLYTVEAQGHTAYGSILCATDDIDHYLIDLTVPGDGAGCADDAGSDFFVPAGESEVDQLLAFFACLSENDPSFPVVDEATVLLDPTLETVLADLDPANPDTAKAITVCQALLPV